MSLIWRLPLNICPTRSGHLGCFNDSKDQPEMIKLHPTVYVCEVYLLLSTLVTHPWLLTRDSLTTSAPADH